MERNIAVAMTNDQISDGMTWTVYIIECDDKSLYTGITTDLDRRFNEHRDSPRSARYFAGRAPIKVVFEESGHDRSSALKREYAIKQLSRSAKLSLIETTIKKGPDPIIREPV